MENFFVLYFSTFSKYRVYLNRNEWMDEKNKFQANKMKV